MLQGQRDLTTVGRLLLSELTPLVNAHQGVIYQMENEETPGLKLLAAYADDGANGHPTGVRSAKAWSANARSKRRILITDMPDDYRAHQFGVVRGSRRATSSCCRCCSKVRSRR